GRHRARPPALPRHAARPRGGGLGGDGGRAREARAAQEAADLPEIDGVRVTDLPLTRTRRLGDFRIHALEAGVQWLDGGAMFGVVPKPLWERRIPADERNRIPLALRCLLVETTDELVLIETGLGNKESEKFIQIYGVDNAAPAGSDDPDRL